MAKFHNFTSIVIGLLFLAVLQTFSNPSPIFRFLIIALILLLALVTYYNWRYLKEIQKYNIWLLIRPILLMLSGFGLFLSIPNPAIRSMFLIITVFVIAFFEAFIGKFAENLLINETLVIAFGAFLSIFEAYFYAPFIGKPLVSFLYLLGFFLFVVLITRSFYEFAPKSVKIKWLASLIISLLSTEFLWALSFLYFHFSVLAFLLFNFYYFCLILNYYYYFNTLNAKKIQFHLAFIFFSSLLVLLATPWKIIS